ncbi:MAG: cyd operon YbgE family protein [Afipia sp.]
MSTSLRRTARPIAFGIALVASLSLMLFPFLLHGIDGMRLHTGLPILMLGVAGMFVYGIGYVPDNRLIRILFGPVCAWTLILAGGLLLLTR